MRNPEKKKRWLGKFLSTLSGKPIESEEEDPLEIIHVPKQKEPIDLSFVKNFTASGGKFFYCEKEEETLNYLQNIIREANLETISCHDKNLQSILSKAGITYIETSPANPDAFCCDCEFLISLSGEIMISTNQTRDKKLADLPKIFIVISKTSQIVKNLRVALNGIQAKYKGNIPSQITTIKDSMKENNIMKQADNQFRSKDIYLLLLEDRL